MSFRLQTAWQRRRKDNISPTSWFQSSAPPPEKPVILTQSIFKNALSAGQTQHCARCSRITWHTSLRADFQHSKTADKKIRQRHAGCQPRWSLPEMPSITLQHNFTDLSAAARQTNPRWRGWASALVFLPARISRSSWLAGPSCSDIAMFRPEVQNSIDLHWKRKETHNSRITPPPQEISTNPTARTDPSATNTGNPPRALRYVRFTSTAFTKKIPFKSLKYPFKWK